MMKNLQNNPWLCAHFRSNMATSQRIRAIAERKGLRVTSLQIPLTMDFTEIFEPVSSYGNKCVDFMSGISNFRQNAPPNMVETFLSELRSRTSEEPDGRLLVREMEGIVIISK